MHEQTTAWVIFGVCFSYALIWVMVFANLFRRIATALESIAKSLDRPEGI